MTEDKEKILRTTIANLHIVITNRDKALEATTEREKEPKFTPRDIHGKAYFDEEPLGDCEECDTKDAEIKALVDALEAIRKTLDDNCTRPPGMGSDTILAICTIDKISRQVLSQHKER